MACKPGTAGANELASLSRHAPLFTKTTARVPDPPICNERGRDRLIVVAEQIGVFCVLSRSAALENQPPRVSLS